MIVNLKKLVLQKELLKAIKPSVTNRSYAKKLDKIADFLDEIERNLEIGGECILDLDKNRLDAIAERDACIDFIKYSDDI